MSIDVKKKYIAQFENLLKEIAETKPKDVPFESFKKGQYIRMEISYATVIYLITDDSKDFLDLKGKVILKDNGKNPYMTEAQHYNPFKFYVKELVKNGRCRLASEKEIELVKKLASRRNHYRRKEKEFIKKIKDLQAANNFQEVYRIQDEGWTIRTEKLKLPTNMRKMENHVPKNK